MTTTYNTAASGGASACPSIAATRFPDQWGKSKKDIQFSYTTLTSERPHTRKGGMPFVKLATFGENVTPRGCYRNDDNVLTVTGAEGDYDGPPSGSSEQPMPIEEAELMLAREGINAFLYSSASNAPDNPRWRVMVPFSVEFSDTTDRMRAHRKAALKCVERVLGVTLAPESYTLSQAFYFGPMRDKEEQYQTAHIEGEYIDEKFQLSIEAPQPNGAEHPLAGLQVDKFDIGQAVSDITQGASYHTAINSLLGHYAARGIPQGTAIEMIKGLMEVQNDGSDRWRERYEDIARCATDIYAKEGHKQEDKYTFRAEGIGYDDTFSPDYVPESVPFVIDKILPQSSFGIAGAGGAMKSTTILRIMIHVVLGKAIFECDILQPGPCVFVSSEDDLQTIRHRIRAMADAIKLTEDERRTLGRDLIIEDVNGSIARLVEQDNQGNLRYSPIVEQMLECYKGRKLSMLCFDPMVYFGPGENFVNDGPALIMNLARRFSAELKCATGFVHHVGQEAYRSNVVDMYAGRGGTAFADNARMVGVMTVGAEGAKHPMPPIIRTLMGSKAEEGAVQFHIPKLSYAKKPDQPIWILRDPNNPWLFHDAWGEKGSDQENKERAEVEELDRRFKAMTAVYQHVRGEVDDGHYPIKTSIAEELHVKIAGIKVGKERLRGIIDTAIVKGFLEVKDLPQNEKRGARKSYISPGIEPFIGAGGLSLKDDRAS